MTVTAKKRKFAQNEDANDVQATVSDFGQKYHCDACNKDVTYLFRIKCATCQDFDLCIECFSTGTETKSHKKDHPYRIMEMLDFPIFESDWGADEELLLVEGLELHGIGNWEQISEHVGTKNKIECAEHYDRVYIQSEQFPFPNPVIKIDISTNRHARPFGYTRKPVSLVPRAPSSQPANHEISGFMPGRREFELEYDNEAEQNIKEIDFAEDDTKEEIDLKCTMLNIYNTALDRRLERKAFIFDRNLIDFRRIQSVEKKRPKEEKELYQKMRVFAKLMTAQDFDVFMDGLVAEQRLRQRTAQLQEYRRMGIITFNDVAVYEREKSTRSTNRAVGLVGFSVERSSSRRHRLDEIFGSQGSNAYGGSGLSAQSSSTSSPAMGGRSNSISGYSGRNTLNSGSIMAAPLSSGGSGLRKVPSPLDVANTDGADLLSDVERILCTNLRLFPRAYLAIKDTFLKEYASKGSLKRKQARQLVKIDVNKSGRLYDFFVEMGWIGG